MSIKRPQIDRETWEKALKELSDKLFEKIEKHGAGACVSLHEIDGLLDEEIREWKDCVHGNQVDKGREELFDSAIASIWGVVSIDNNTTTEEWDG